MAKLGAKARRNSRLLGIELPRVKVYQCRLMLDSIDQSKRPPGDCVRKQPEVAPTADAPVISATPDSRRRKLEDGVTIRGKAPVGEPFRVGHSIEIVPNRKDRGIIEKSLLGENIKGPECVLNDGKARRSITEDGLLYGVHQTKSGVADVRAKLRAIEIVKATVGEPMTADLMAGRRNAAH